MSPNSLTAATDGGAGSSWTLGETGRGRGRDCRDGVTSGGDHHNGRITSRTCSGEARVCKRVGQVKQNKQKSNKNRSKVQEVWQEAPAMVCSREELWQEWTGSRSERREEELCRSAQSDLAHWQGQHPQRGTAKQEIELPFSVCLTPFTYWPCPSSWLLPWNPWKNYPSSSAASDHPWQTWRII